MPAGRLSDRATPEAASRASRTPPRSPRKTEMRDALKQRAAQASMPDGDSSEARKMTIGVTARASPDRRQEERPPLSSTQAAPASRSAQSRPRASRPRWVAWNQLAAGHMARPAGRYANGG